MTEVQEEMFETTTPEAAADDGWEWAFVEIMGHRSHAGRCREVEWLGGKVLRIDVPVNGDPVSSGWKTHRYPLSAIFSYTLTDEASVMRENKPYEPPARYRLSAPMEGEEEDPI
jgi:hypothetical protein